MLKRKWMEELRTPRCLLLKNTRLIKKKKMSVFHNSDYMNIELKGLRVKVSNQNILINAEEK